MHRKLLQLCLQLITINNCFDYKTLMNYKKCNICWVSLYCNDFLKSRVQSCIILRIMRNQIERHNFLVPHSGDNKT